MSDLWDWFEYEIRMTNGSLLLSHTSYNEQGDALDGALARALSAPGTVDTILILLADFDDYIM